MKSPGLYQRGKGKTWYVRYQKADGTIARESAKTTSKKEAQSFLEKRRVQKREGTLPDTSPVKRHAFNELAKEYLADGDVKALKSFRERRYRVQQLVAKYGNLPLTDFNTKVIKQLKDELRGKNKPATVNRMLSLVKNMFEKAASEEYGMVSGEVLQRVRTVKSIKEENERSEYLSKEQCQELIDVCSPHLKPIVITALNTGARREEILSLQWKQVDLKRGFIKLNKTKNGKSKTIPINETLRATLESIPHGPESLYVFTDRNGNRYKSVDTSFPTACRRAGIADFHFHDLRHTFASQLAEAKVPLATLNRLLGHKRLVSTMRYAHLSDSHMINAVKLLDKNNGVSDTVSDTVLSGGEYGEL